LITSTYNSQYVSREEDDIRPVSSSIFDLIFDIGEIIKP